MKLATLFVVTVITGSCCDVPDEHPAFELEGEWVNTWSTEEFRETLTIEAVESFARKYALHFEYGAGFGERSPKECTAVFVDTSLVLSQVHGLGPFVVLTPEWDGDELLLAPYPSSEVYRDAGKPRAVFRRVEKP